LSNMRQPHLYSMAEGPGFEPGFTESESVVLPLNDPPAVCVRKSYQPKRVYDLDGTFNTTNAHHYQ
jgi:hypothetical protein